MIQMPNLSVIRFSIVGALVVSTFGGCSDSEEKPLRFEDLSAEEMFKLSDEEKQEIFDNLSEAEKEALLSFNMDDGPFEGASFKGDVNQLEISEKVAFNEGELLICNRSEEECPVLAFRNQDMEVEWAVEMDPSLSKEYDNTHLVEIYGCQMSDDGGKSVLHYTANWDYGHEHGYTYFDLDGGLQHFFLSW